MEEWLEEEPGDPIARHMLAACTGRDVPERASSAFVEKTFDSFASSFESKLASLSYRAPSLIAAMLEDSGLEPSHCLDVLDAGCGTGLCGPIVAPFARWLVGVDLSEGMLAHANDKNVYHALMKAELTEFLRDNGEAFDLIVSADTLVYFGDLKGAIAAFAYALRPNGLFVFTLEHAVRRQRRCRLPSGAARSLQSCPGQRRAVARVRGPAVEDNPSGIAHGGGRAGARAGDSCSQVYFGPCPAARECFYERSG